jgi:ketosteroid isomerase-like protein
MTQDDLMTLAARFLAAWNAQDVERVLACYTDDFAYRDPNTRGDVRGAPAMRRYLTKLFAAWDMHWSVREVFPLADAEGCTFLWRASFRRGGAAIELDGADLVVLRDGKIARNDVYFDRAPLEGLPTGASA